MRVKRNMNKKNLDVQFGQALPPSRKPDYHEQNFTPKSKEKLDINSGEKLRNFMNEVKDGLKFPKITFWTVKILWIMDEKGEIYFSIEEVIDDRGRLFFPLPDSLKIPEGKMKLGHPSLVECRAARIAGEINFDYEANTPGWTISNKSGRYGLRKTTTENHLNNIIGVFKHYGVELSPWFSPGSN
jgi:hypothetical protein